MENKQVYQTIGSVIVLFTLFGGAVWLVKETNEKTSCRKGFEYIEQGERQGYYGCETKSSTRYEICTEVWDSANTENYWCKKGEIVNIEKTVQSINNINVIEHCNYKECL